MQNPIVTNKRSIAYYLGSWLVIILVQWSITTWLLHQSLVGALLDSIIFNSFLAVIFIAIWPMVMYSGLEKVNLLNTFITHLVGGALLISVATYTAWQVAIYILQNYAEYLTFLTDSILWRFALAFIYYLILVLNLYAYINMQSFKAQKLEEADLKRLLKEAELDRLKAQLNPHFIFNSLNSISALTVSNPAKAQEMVISLAAFLRYAVQSEAKPQLSLANELAAIEQFIEIEKVRFGERLHVTVKVPDNCKQLLVPTMIVQPLVENAIKYGVHETIQEAHIVIMASCIDSLLQVTIENTFEETDFATLKTGIGLKNVKERLHLTYGQLDLLVTEKQQDKFIVTLKIPQIG